MLEFVTWVINIQRSSQFVVIGDPINGSNLTSWRHNLDHPLWISVLKFSFFCCPYFSKTSNLKLLIFHGSPLYFKAYKYLQCFYLRIHLIIRTTLPLVFLLSPSISNNQGYAESFCITKTAPVLSSSKVNNFSSKTTSSESSMPSPFMAKLHTLKCYHIFVPINANQIVRWRPC